MSQTYPFQRADDGVRRSAMGRTRAAEQRRAQIAAGTRPDPGAVAAPPPEDPYDRLRREARARVHLAALGMYDDGPASPRVVKEARLANPSRIQLKNLAR